MKTCTMCNETKSISDFYVRRASQDGLSCYCKTCQNIGLKRYSDVNRKEINRKGREYYHGKGRLITGHESRDKNKKCTQYLGIYVGERLCKHLFKDVEMMPEHNPGFDMICNKGLKIDVKTACTCITERPFYIPSPQHSPFAQKTNNSRPFTKRYSWMFAIKKNTTADYFLCVAFDNRENLTPLYMWLIPGNKVNTKQAVSICPSTIHKWDKWKHDINDVQLCCTKMKINGAK